MTIQAFAAQDEILGLSGFFEKKDLTKDFILWIMARMNQEPNEPEEIEDDFDYGDHEDERLEALRDKYDEKYRRLDRRDYSGPHYMFRS